MKPSRPSLISANRNDSILRFGFSLIELVVSVVVITLLIALLSMIVPNARRAAEITQCLNNLKEINAGTASYSAQWGGVIATGVPPEILKIVRGGGRPPRPDFKTSWERIFDWESDATFHYGVMNRYWFAGLAQYISQEQSSKAVWDEVFNCPNDNFYFENWRPHPGPKSPTPTPTIHRISYLMSDTAFWAPEMFTDENIGMILEEDELYNDGDGRPATMGPATANTPGRRYLPASQVRFPNLKVYIYEVNAYHDNPRLGYNTRGLRGTALFYDGHAELKQASSTEDRAGDLFIEMKCRMGWTDEAPDNNDPLWWYYSTTRDGIFGRDFIR